MSAECPGLGRDPGGSRNAYDSGATVIGTPDRRGDLIMQDDQSWPAIRRPTLGGTRAARCGPSKRDLPRVGANEVDVVSRNGRASVVHGNWETPSKLRWRIEQTLGRFARNTRGFALPIANAGTRFKSLAWRSTLEGLSEVRRARENGLKTAAGELGRSSLVEVER
ncbi:hypothetical protein KM043_003956 [Ampulex compressa]|nr:hypothetical protein KM043_003956 [Ampulex compressa]